MLYDQVHEAINFLKSKIPFNPDIGLVLGSGLNTIIDEVSVIDEIDYTDIPNFISSTAPGHAGKLIFAEWMNIKFAILSGRVHFYEGHSLAETTIPVRVLNGLGIKWLVLTSSCGSVNEDMNPGSLVIIRDHINLLPDNPLRGPNDKRFGPRFPDMLNAYNNEAIQKAKEVSATLLINIHTGVLAIFSGPALETASEYIFAKFIGADLVGMSIVPAVIVARHEGLKVLAVSVVTDQFTGNESEEVTSEIVLSRAKNASEDLKKLFRMLMPELLRL